mgnify:CR=1 FL=1
MDVNNCEALAVDFFVVIPSFISARLYQVYHFLLHLHMVYNGPKQQVFTSTRPSLSLHQVRAHVTT